MPAVEYETLDVFTATRFGGNPLAVIPGAEGLSAEQMQRIATEFNADVGALFSSGLAESNEAAVTLAFLEAWKKRGAR